jgi:hypothetical protein
VKLEETLFYCGYRLVEDAWESEGRRTYIHDDEASRTHLADLRQALAKLGWLPHPSKLRSYLNQVGDELEIEPGGAETSGHFLHHVKLFST